MADDTGKKNLDERRAIAKQKQRAKALLLTKLSVEQRDRVLLALEALADTESKMVERDLYEKRGDFELAKKFGPQISKTVEDTSADLDEVENVPDEGEQEGSDQDQQDNQSDDSPNERRKPKNKRPQEREKQPKKAQPEGKSQSTKIKPTKPVPKPPMPAGGAGGATGVRTSLAVLTKTPQFWIVVGVVLLVILLIALFFWLAGGAHKSFNESGGSFPIAMDYGNKEHRDLVAKVMSLRDSGSIVFINGTEKDIEWQDNGKGDFSHKLDWRTMVTLEYLGAKWFERTDGIIQVSLLASNAPDFTRRKAVMKLAGVTVGGDSEEPLDAPSAYATGQGIGISVIGRVSNELASACFNDKDGNRKNNAPVEVAWQEIASQEVIRPTYEQLQVDAEQVFEGLKVLQGLAKQAKKSSTGLDRYTQALTVADSIYTLTGISLDNMIENLQKVTSLQGKGIDQRTKDYAGSAVTLLTTVRQATRADVLAWDDPVVIQSMRDGLEKTFRMMQVANMVGWKTPAKPNCRLWKAYEARENIRQLVLDLERMPAEPSLIEDGGGDWNADLMVRQLIVYSPEDDLDNGLSDMDVFPKGAISVDEGGVGYDDTGKDGVTDQKDNHFMALPIDNGVFSKAGTIFVFKTGLAGRYTELSLGAVTAGATMLLDQMHDLFSGTGTSTYSGENLQKVTYKNFVHIGF